MILSLGRHRHTVPQSRPAAIYASKTSELSPQLSLRRAKTALPEPTRANSPDL